MRIWTLQLAKWRLAKQKGFHAVDITVKSWRKEFAPDWDFLMAYKASAQDATAEREYTIKYLYKLERLLDADAEVLVSLLRHEDLVLMCYCPAGKFCHRHLLANKLQEVGMMFGIVVELCGELTD